MNAVRKGERVVDSRKKGVVGTARADSDPISKLADIAWDHGGSSLIFVDVLAPAREQGRAVA